MIDGKPALLELFCGTKSVGKEFEKRGVTVVSSDFDPQFDATITADILTLDPHDFAHIGFDFIWASPPCNAFTVMLIGKNWTKDHQPKTDSARLGMKILDKTVEFIEVMTAANPKLQWWFENPRAKMRKMPVVQRFTRQTVTYCQYGDTRMKPTDIWTNTEWQPRPICKNGAPCHESAPRGSKGGTQGITSGSSTSRDRAVIPAELCAEIADYALGHL